LGVTATAIGIVDGTGGPHAAPPSAYRRADWRTFRLDRVLSQRSPGTRFVRRVMSRQALAMVADAVTSGPYRYRVRVRMQAAAAEVAEKVPADA